MYIHPEILCAGVPGQLHDVGQLDSSTLWDETPYRKDSRQGYYLSGVACKNNDKWNRAVLILSAAL